MSKKDHGQVQKLNDHHGPSSVLCLSQTNIVGQNGSEQKFEFEKCTAAAAAAEAHSLLHANGQP